MPRPWRRAMRIFALPEREKLLTLAPNRDATNRPSDLRAASRRQLSAIIENKAPSSLRHLRRACGERGWQLRLHAGRRAGGQRALSNTRSPMRTGRTASRRASSISRSLTAFGMCRTPRPTATGAATPPSTASPSRPPRRTRRRTSFTCSYVFSDIGANPKLNGSVVLFRDKRSVPTPNARMTPNARRPSVARPTFCGHKCRRPNEECRRRTEA